MRRLLQVATIALLMAGLVAPVVEIFDQWDHTVQDGNDTEMNLVVAVLCVGMGVLVARAVASTARLDRGSKSFVVSDPLRAELSHALFTTVITTTSSPPATLRI